MTAIVPILSVLAGIVSILTLLFGIVILGIRREPTDIELNRRPPTLISYIARRLLGVGVRRPDDKHESCLVGSTSSDTDPWGMGR
jgi:hypothetical protein